MNHQLAWKSPIVDFEPSTAIVTATPTASAIWRIMLSTPEPVAKRFGGQDARHRSVDRRLDQPDAEADRQDAGQRVAQVVAVGGHVRGQPHSGEGDEQRAEDGDRPRAEARHQVLGVG
jgi:hypothetical protein